MLYTRKTIFLLLVLAVTIILVGLHFFKSRSNTSPHQSPTPSYSSNGIKSEVPTDWKTYQNDEFAFQFKYPPYATICNIPSLHPEVEKELIFDLAISMRGECQWSGQYVVEQYLVSADIFLHIDTVSAQDNAPNDENLQIDFYRDFGGIDKSLNPNIGYLTVDGLRAYGGVIKRNTSGAQEYILLINKWGRRISIWDKNYDAHRKETNIVVNSFHFSTEKYPR